MNVEKHVKQVNALSFLAILNSYDMALQMVLVFANEGRFRSLEFQISVSATFHHESSCLCTTLEMFLARVNCFNYNNILRKNKTNLSMLFLYSAMNNVI